MPPERMGRLFGFTRPSAPGQVEFTKLKTDEEVREERLKLLRSFNSNTLTTTVIPNYEGMVAMIDQTGKLAPEGLPLTDKEKTKYKKEYQEKIELVRQILQERGNL